MIHPEAAWAMGATGQGITVAVIDNGVISGTHDLTGRVSSNSSDVVGTRNQPFQSRDQHGTMVAGFVGANFDNRGTVGVAYNSTVLAIRADEIGPCGDDAGAPANSDCGFFGSDIAKGIDYATNHGARVINLSLGGDTPSGSSTQAALLRAVQAGQVIVAAAGNADTGQPPAASPGWPARFATDTAYNGQIIAVGALNSTGTDIASFSYRAGVTQNFYILAPGENVFSGCGLPSPTTPGGTVCYSGSGTSFATPHVSGAAALLMSGFPNLNAHDVVDILLRSARDMGPTGVDAVYGRGALDIARAFSPIGALSVPTAVGQTIISDDAGPGAVSGVAFGDALSHGEGLATVGYDDYRRMFRLNLGDSYHRPASRSLAAGLPALSQGAVQLTMPDGASFKVAALANSDAERPSGVIGLRETHEGLLNVSASYAKGPVRFDLWTGQAGIPPMLGNEPVDAFSAMAGAEQAARAGYASGRWTFSAEGGAGKRSIGEEFAMTGAARATEESSSHYARLMANFRDHYLSTTVGVGQLDEKGGPLGSLAPAESDLAMPATSRFVTLRTEWNGVPGLSLSAEGAVGKTHAQGRLLTLHNAVSSSWRLRGEADCSLLKLACSGMAVELSQPVRIEHGTMTAYLADQPADYFDAITFSDRRLELSPSGREVDLRVSAWRSLGPGSLRLEASAISDEFHRADAPLNLGVTAGWRARF